MNKRCNQTKAANAPLVIKAYRRRTRRTLTRFNKLPSEELRRTCFFRINGASRVVLTLTKEARHNPENFVEFAELAWSELRNGLCCLVVEPSVARPRRADHAIPETTGQVYSNLVDDPDLAELVGLFVANLPGFWRHSPTRRPGLDGAGARRPSTGFSGCSVDRSRPGQLGQRDLSKKRPEPDICRWPIWNNSAAACSRSG
jgi:hypothetical protein